MSDRDLVPLVAVGAIVCCGTTALVSGLVSGVALAALGRFTAATVVGLGIVVMIAWRLDRRRRSDHGTANTVARSVHCEELTQ